MLLLLAQQSLGDQIEGNKWPSSSCFQGLNTVASCHVVLFCRVSVVEVSTLNNVKFKPRAGFTSYDITLYVMSAYFDPIIKLCLHAEICLCDVVLLFCIVIFFQSVQGTLSAVLNPCWFATACFSSGKASWKCGVVKLRVDRRLGDSSYGHLSLYGQ